MAGLQLIAPTVAKRWVTSAVAAPMRAAAVAASQPAWPPPITMTSNDFSMARFCATFNSGSTDLTARIFRPNVGRHPPRCHAVLSDAALRSRYRAAGGEWGHGLFERLK